MKEDDCWSEQSPENRLYRLFRFLWATRYSDKYNAIVRVISLEGIPIFSAYFSWCPFSFRNWRYTTCIFHLFVAFIGKLSVSPCVRHSYCICFRELFMLDRLKKHWMKSAAPSASALIRLSRNATSVESKIADPPLISCDAEFSHGFLINFHFTDSLFQCAGTRTDVGSSGAKCEI